MEIKTLKQLEQKLSALGEMSNEQRADVVCSLIGHSRIQTTCFGYFYCGRCEAQLGDTLGGTYSAENIVIVNHNCEKCRTNFDKCDWRDMYLAPDPFSKEGDA